VVEYQQYVERTKVQCGGNHPVLFALHHMNENTAGDDLKDFRRESKP